MSPELESKFEQITNAIYIIEGADKTKYPYGIKSIDTKGNKDFARRICLNTVRNNYIRWRQSDRSLSYLEFLQRRFCPIGAPDDPRNLNSHWLRNLISRLGKDFEIS